MMMFTSVVVVLMTLWSSLVTAFSPGSFLYDSGHNRGFHSPTSPKGALSLVTTDSTSILLAEETWRQYVPLAVSVFVIVDILLGSPALRLVTDRMNPKEDTLGKKDKNKPYLDRSQERIDTEEVANKALEKARATLELRRFLDENKTDEQRYQEIRAKMDAKMSALDAKLAERSELGKGE